MRSSLSRCRTLLDPVNLTLRSSRLIESHRFHRLVSQMAPSKRKISDPDTDGKPAEKRGRDDSKRFHPNSKQVEDFGIILRDFYPPEVCLQCQASLKNPSNLMISR